MNIKMTGYGVNIEIEADVNELRETYSQFKDAYAELKKDLKDPTVIPEICKNLWNVAKEFNAEKAKARAEAEKVYKATVKSAEPKVKPAKVGKKA